MKVSIKTSGAQQARQHLKDVKAMLKSPTPLGQALHAGAMPIMESARAKARGKIGNAIQVLGVFMQGAVAVCVIGVRKLPEALWIELGTGFRSRKGGKDTKKRTRGHGLGAFGSTGQVSPRPFLRPAMDEEADAAREAMKRSLFDDALGGIR